MNIAIVDDSRSEQRTIENAVKAWADNLHQSISLSMFENGESFIEGIADSSFDIVFMDIYMDGISGIEASKKLREHSLDTLLIFMTTSPDHMADAFPCHAFDYILKPISLERLNKTLDEALKLLPDNQPYLDITFEKQKLSLLYSEIFYILSSSNYCIVKTTKAEYRIRTPFNTLTAQFEGCSCFFVINRGILVNLDNVLKTEGCECIMSDKSSLPISRRKKADLEQAVLNRRFEKRRKGGSL